MRNDYEYALGHFRGALPAGTVNFRELQTVLTQYRTEFRGKKIIQYCTGGIRCEKSTVMLREAGFDDVYELDGGVVKYLNAYADTNWLGSLYTFDGRVSTRLYGSDLHETIGICMYTNIPTDTCENCRYSPCNAKLICTTEAYQKHGGFCSQYCFIHAGTDMLVRQAHFDKYDYQAARTKAKNHPTHKDDIVAEVATHLQQKWGKVVYHHATTPGYSDHVVDSGK
jgi:predicted sulfurtransferase